jgi:hypothetical protein
MMYVMCRCIDREGANPKIVFREPETEVLWGLLHLEELDRFGDALDRAGSERHKARL